MNSKSSVWRLAGASVVIAALGLLLAGCGVNNIPTYEESAKAKWSRGAQPISAPRRPHSQSGRDREGLCRAGAAGAGSGDQRARARDPDAGADPPDIVTNPEAFKRFQDAQAQLTGALGRLLAVSERYPDLKSNQNFLALQSQLEGTENRIAVARRDYIEAVRRYNTELRTFPGVIWASTLYRNNKPMETFTVAEDVTRPPQVKF